MRRVFRRRARRSSAINHESRVDQARIERQALGINHICSSWGNHSATFPNRGNPTILHKNGAIFYALARLHHNCCVIDQVTAHLRGAHGHGRRTLRENRGNERERQKSK